MAVKETPNQHVINVKNKVMSITGGYGHLGSAIVSNLLAHQAKVWVLARDQDKFEGLKIKLDHPENLNFCVCDISDSASIKSAYETINNISGGLDCLINNATYLSGQSPENMKDEDWANGIDGVLNSVFKSIREALPFLRKGSTIINVSSMYGMVSPDFSVYNSAPNFLNPPHYGAAKAGVIQMTRYYANYLGPKGIRVNSVTPGAFPSPAVQQINPEFIDKLAQKTSLGRIGKPEEVAGVFTFLASDAASYITGQNFVIDGGWTSM